MNITAIVAQASRLPVAQASRLRGAAARTPPLRPPGRRRDFVDFGVEWTARDACERGFAQVFVEDAMTGLSPGAHELAIKTIFPRIGRIVSTEDLL